MTELGKGLSPAGVSGRIEMPTPDEVSVMLGSKVCACPRPSRQHHAGAIDEHPCTGNSHRVGGAEPPVADSQPASRSGLAVGRDRGLAGHRGDDRRRRTPRTCAIPRSAWSHLSGLST